MLAGPPSGDASFTTEKIISAERKLLWRPFVAVSCGAGRALVPLLRRGLASRTGVVPQVHEGLVGITSGCCVAFMEFKIPFLFFVGLNMPAEHVRCTDGISGSNRLDIWSATSIASPLPHLALSFSFTLPLLSKKRSHLCQQLLSSCCYQSLPPFLLNHLEHSRSVCSQKLPRGLLLNDPNPPVSVPASAAYDFSCDRELKLANSVFGVVEVRVVV